MTGYDPRYGFDLPTVEEPAKPAAAPVRKRRWVRRILKWCGIFLAAVLATFGGLRWYWGFEAQQAVDQRVAALDRVDANWQWSQILAARAAVDEGQNAAHIVTAAAAAIPPEWPNRPAVPPHTPPRTGPQAPAGFVPLPWHQRLEDVGVEFRMDESIASAMRDELRALGGALGEARRLIDGPTTGRFEVNWQALPGETRPTHPERVRTVGTLLSCDALLRAHDGQLGDALASCRGVLAAGRAIGDEPATASQQARINCHFVAVRLLEPCARPMSCSLPSRSKAGS
jgi:hypothetical protein